MNNQRVAILDLGTNTLKLLIAEKQDGQWDFILDTAISCRLGEGLKKTKRLLPIAKQRTLDALDKAIALCERSKVSKIHTIATEAFRIAENGEDFRLKIKRELNLDFQVITGEEEAALALEMLKHEFPGSQNNNLIIDIGGGSTELSAKYEVRSTNEKTKEESAKYNTESAKYEVRSANGKTKEESAKCNTESAKYEVRSTNEKTKQESAKYNTESAKYEVRSANEKTKQESAKYDTESSKYEVRSTNEIITPLEEGVGGLISPLLSTREGAGVSRGVNNNASNFELQNTESPSTNFGLRTSNFGLQNTESPSTNFELQTSNFELQNTESPSTNFGLRTSNFGLRTSNFELRVSLPMGCVTLTEEFLPSDPPTDEEVHALQAHIKSVISQFPEPSNPLSCIGLAGTLVTLGSIHLGEFNAEKIHGLTMTYDQIDIISLNLNHLTIEERKEIPGMILNREDVLPAGAIALLEIMAHFHADTVTISTHGIRHGYLYSLERFL